MIQHKTPKILAILALGLFMAGCERPAASIATERGPALAQEKGCIACHGLDGQGTGPTFPDINGQWFSYLRTQLTRYRDGERVNAIMNGQTSGLTGEEIDILAAYYSAQ